MSLFKFIKFFKNIQMSRELKPDKEHYQLILDLLL